MSLLSLLQAPGPVRDWFAANFAQTAPVCKEVNRMLRGGTGQVSCAVPPVQGTEHGLVGTAVGYVLAAHLREDGLEETAARMGAQILNRPMPNFEPPPTVIERHAAARIRELAPSRRRLEAEEWTELLRLCGLLSRFESVYRAGPAGVVHLLPLIVRFGRSLEVLSRQAISQPALEDPDGVARATLEDHGDLREARELHLGPTFAQSLALGGADADVIADGRLIELKSSAAASPFGRVEAWQVLGYLLADTDDRYTIRGCELAALRRRRTYTWEAQELVDALHGGPSQPVELWRGEFAQLLARGPAASRPVARRSPGPRPERSG